MFKNILNKTIATVLACATLVTSTQITNSAGRGGKTVFLPAVQSTSDGTVNDPYSYPIMPESDAWKAFTTHNQMVEATQIPAAELDQMSTDKLLHAVLDHPLLGDMAAFDDYTTGYQNHLTNFTGLSQFLNRSDAGEKLLAYYRRTNLPAQHAGAQYLGDMAKQIEFVELSLMQPEIQRSLSASQKTELAAQTAKRLAEKIERVDTYDLSSASVTRALSQVALQTTPGTVMNINSIPANVQDSVLARAEAQVSLSTPKGSSVTALQNPESLSAATIASYDAYFKKTYPQATLVSSSTSKYNCHSYAWYSQTVSNTYWINDPNQRIFWQDGSYKFVQDIYPDMYSRSTLTAGMRVWYSKGDHSAYVEQTGTEKLISKWGRAPVMRHKIAYAPYNTSMVKTYKR